MTLSCGESGTDEIQRCDSGAGTRSAWTKLDPLDLFETLPQDGQISLVVGKNTFKVYCASKMDRRFECSSYAYVGTKVDLLHLFRTL